MIEKHYVSSVEEFLDAYAPDKENGLHQHKFRQKVSQIENENENDEERQKQLLEDKDKC